MEPTWEDKQFGVKLYLADCMDVLPTLDMVDAVVTDPPYGIGADKGVGKYGRLRKYQERWDGVVPNLTPVLAIGVPTIIWGGNYFALPPSRKWLVWDKGEGFKGRDFAECELAWCSEDGNARTLKYDPLAGRDYHGKQHPTQKPITVMRWCLESLADSSIVLDPFMGSGTTGVAAVQLGRQFIGIEREPKYFEIAVRRISEAIVKKQGGALCATHIPTQLGLLG